MLVKEIASKRMNESLTTFATVQRGSRGPWRIYYYSTALCRYRRNELRRHKMHNRSWSLGNSLNSSTSLYATDLHTAPMCILYTLYTLECYPYTRYLPTYLPCFRDCPTSTVAILAPLFFNQMIILLILPSCVPVFFILFFFLRYKNRFISKPHFNQWYKNQTYN